MIFELSATQSSQSTLKYLMAHTIHSAFLIGQLNIFISFRVR